VVFLVLQNYRATLASFFPAFSCFLLARLVANEVRGLLSALFVTTLFSARSLAQQKFDFLELSFHASQPC